MSKNKLYKYTFSPPARLAWLTAKIYKVPTEIVDIDLARAEQLDPEFMKINPKHEVPAFDHNGEYVTESREIAKYFHENFNQNEHDNDHWYPKDPEKRAKVDEWLAWSDRRHMTFCKPPLLYAASTVGMPWRETCGIIVAIMGYIVRNNKDIFSDMKACLSEAEQFLSKRQIQEVDDLNLGDLAVFFESSLSFFLLSEIQFDDYPAFKNLYHVIQKIQEFEQIEQEYIAFTNRVHEFRKIDPTPTLFTYISEIWASFKLVAYITWNDIQMNTKASERLPEYSK